MGYTYDEELVDIDDEEDLQLQRRILKLKHIEKMQKIEENKKLQEEKKK